VERRHGFPERVAGRIGHGYRNTGGLSVHPDNETVLEPGMILSVEPMYATMHGFFVLEDQYLVTEAGAEPLHPLAAQSLPIVPA
jgi:Xaa-Pro aminopeptidase